MPKHWAAETKGFDVFRCVTGPDAFVTQVFLKSQAAQGWSQPNAGTLTVTGLGKVWADVEGGRGGIRWQHSVVKLPDDPVEESACGRRTAYTTRPDGGGTIAADLNDLCGKRATYERTAADGTVETRSHALYE